GTGRGDRTRVLVADVARDGRRRSRCLGRRRCADAQAPCEPLRACRAGPDGPTGAAAGSAMSYRRRASPLHVARAGAGCAYCVALACAALLLSSPVALGAVV